MIAQIPTQMETVLGRFGQPLFLIGGTPVTIASVISFLLILLIAFTLSKMLQRGLSRVYRRRSLEEGVQYALNRLLHYAILGFGIFVALDNLGISITALAGLGAILAVGIGFGLQNIAQNFVSGLILLLERPVKKGDFVEVGGTRGTVRQIHARATVITTLDNVDILVPNGQFITETVVNQTFDNRRVRVRVNVGVAYGSDTDKVRRALERVAREHPRVLDSPAPIVRFEDFGDSSLDFSLLVWLADPVQQPQTSSDLRFAIDRVFREEEIEIPFPQRDLHLRSGWEEAIGAGRK
ncbi:MAG TPA: mechanosensitive ion channel domain-containing protein [Longimicrobiaceae bacterium]|nr:mechanosensitive ion channel domain-containing protein [Longimicrobiaceae bacterium]